MKPDIEYLEELFQSKGWQLVVLNLENRKAALTRSLIEKEDGELRGRIKELGYFLDNIKYILTK